MLVLKMSENPKPDRSGRPKLKAGEALRLIYEHKLYTDKYSSFAEYCHKQWGFSSQHAFALIDRAKASALRPAKAIERDANGQFCQTRKDIEREDELNHSRAAVN